MVAPESNMHRLEGPDLVHAAVGIARAFCVENGLRGAIATRVPVVVEELVMNLVDHGGPHATDRVDIGLWRESGGVGMVLVAGGRPFDPRAVDVPAAIPSRGGGAGLAIVRAWTQILDYRSDDGRNRLELRIPDAPS